MSQCLNILKKLFISPKISAENMNMIIIVSSSVGNFNLNVFSITNGKVININVNRHRKALDQFL